MLTSSALRLLHEMRFFASPDLFRAPGRVNLVGEHTDYADGFCLPAALNLSTLIAASPRTDGKLVLYSAELNEEAALDLAALGEKGRGHWSDYPAGVAHELQLLGIRNAGASLTITGDVPISSGLSSSASLEVATAGALLHLFSATLSKTELALLCQRAENKYVGAPCGIMDQFISANGIANHALILDTRALTGTPAPIPDNVRLVICNSMVKHSVGGGEYGERRAQVEEATRVMHSIDANVRALRDVTYNALVAAEEKMDPLAFKRARHVITDSARVHSLAHALAEGNLSAAGQIMLTAHTSYRDDFAASCAECDILVEIAASLPGCYGSRLTGGGFGGCTVSLVDNDAASQFAEELHRHYHAKTGIDAQIYICSIAQGLHQVV